MIVGPAVEEQLQTPRRRSGKIEVVERADKRSFDHTRRLAGHADGTNILPHELFTKPGLFGKRRHDR